jgi:GH15 family glucan-1,4-alpha-glucosidase
MKATRTRPFIVMLLALVMVGATAGQRAHLPEERLITGPRQSSAETYATSGQATADQLWLATGTVPGGGTRWEDMARWALVDIRSYLSPNGAVSAGPGGPWRYFWPRDGSFAAVALSRSGHHQEAAQILDRLARLEYDPARGFQARYELDGSPLTDRPRQSDGCGWVLWAIAEVRAEDPAGVPATAADLRDRCVRTLTTLVDAGARLPAPSPDYWELPVDRTSLGTVAPMVAGLAASADDYSATGQAAQAAATRLVAARLSRVVLSRFGPDYERFGSRGGVDAAVAVLLPPFQRSPLGQRTERAVRDAWLRYQREALQPAGGLAPGADWGANDGASWTPETALVALTAAATGREATAARWLDWLDVHRTATGSLPEKVTRTGRPAGPAPLVWTAALTLLTLDELGQR